MRHRLATLFVDIAGSTRLVVRHPAETVLGVVRCFAGLVSEVASAHHGRVKDFEGDGVLLYFQSVRDAVEAALAILDALDRRQCDTACEGGPAAGARLSLSVGEVAMGTIGSADHSALAIVGSSVNLGARLLKVPPPGGLVATEEIVGALQAEAPWLAGRFELLDPAFEVPGAGGLTVAVYALADAATAPS